ncbi:MAG: carbamoyltransferase [Rhodothermales bacterium]|nr:carbamoyltransferase [Rhodothermales bacterium]
MTTYILGISAFYHDSAACIVADGQIVAAAQEERFTRQKHDHRFPAHAIDYCLEEAGITVEDLAFVVFYDKPWLKFERLLETYLSFAPRGIRSFMKAMPLWLKEKLWMDQTIKDRLDHDVKVYFPEHHQSHAASAFFPSPFESAAIITMDGVGEWATASWGTGTANQIDISHEMHFPHSLGLLYSAFTYYTGFRVNSGEYKLMGLAPYGDPVYVDKILENLIDVKEDGSFWMNMKYFNYCQGLTMTSTAFHELFGGDPRSPESEVRQRDMDLARSVQEVVELVMLRTARHVRAHTGERNLCLAGGVALNCVANGKILAENIFDKIWIQPAAGDAGGALGAALFGWHQILGKSRKPVLPDSQHGSYLGPVFSQAEIEQTLKDEGAVFSVLNAGEIAKEAAALVSGGSVVGLFAGRMEFGPRALGARSILGDPRSPAMQSLINRKIKYRESFRPFAPACLSDHAQQYFDLEVDSPYMLLVAPVSASRRLPAESQGVHGFERLKQVRSDIPAVTHVDFSARVQTVDENSNTTFRAILDAFHNLTGCPVLINTSFNVRGEPIVCTPGDAYRCFMNTEMDALVMENIFIKKADQPLRQNRPSIPATFSYD